VLVGDSVQLQPDNNLRMPPEKPKRSDTLGASKERYDSVKGQNKEIYVLYTNGHAYPSYLITYACLVKFEGLSSRGTVFYFDLSLFNSFDQRLFFSHSQIKLDLSKKFCLIFDRFVSF
jgi:hypothetical protein